MKQFKRQENVKIRPGTNHDSKGVSLPSQSSVSIQPELEMTQPGDAYEQEADQMADRITDHAATAGAPVSRVSRPGISRAPSGYASVSVSPSLESAISSSRGGGFSMPAALKARMESGFGADFSQVRLHTDSTAASMSSSIRANAFTSGNDIYFASGKYDPSSRSGQHLIAHELTHTLQQSGKVARDSSDEEKTSIALPVPERATVRIRREEREAENKENRCQLYLYYILKHDPEIVKENMSDEDAKKVSSLFTTSIKHQRALQSKAWTLEHILDENGIKSVSTDWLTDFLADEYHVFEANYEAALERALATLAERRLAETYLKRYSHRRTSQKLSNVKVFSDSTKADIFGQLLDEANQEFYSPTPYKRYLAERYAAFRTPALENSMSINDANAVRKNKKDEEEAAWEREKQAKEERENEEYAAFCRYLCKRFFPTYSEEYYDVVRNTTVTIEDLKKAFGFNKYGALEVEERNPKKILKLYEAIMSDLAKKAGGDPKSISSMSSAYTTVWDNAAVEASEDFKWDKRFVAYEKQLIAYLKDKTVYSGEYFELPDTFVSAETYTRIFCTIMTTALSFIPVGAFAGMGQFVGKAAHFFSTKVVPKLVDVAVNESFDTTGTNQADMDLLTQALALGVETFFSKLPAVSQTKLGGLIEGAAKDSLQSMASDTSGYLVKYMYGEDVGNWAMVTTKNAMTSFVKSLGTGVAKEAHKRVFFGGEDRGYDAAADKANKEFNEKKITLDQYDAEMERVNSLKEQIDVRNDFALQLEGEALGVADKALGVSEAIEKQFNPPDAVPPVMVVPVEEILTINDL